MSDIHVLEYLCSSDGVWVLPEEQVEKLRRDFPGVRFSTPRDPADVDRVIREADVVLGYAAREDNFASARRLRWIQITAAGVGKRVLFPALVESDVILTNGRGLHSVAMAEHTIGVMLAFVRKLHLARDAQNRKRWIQDDLWLDPRPFGTLRGATLGIVGLGSIGREIAVRAQALGMRVIALRRHPTSDPAPADAQWGPEKLGELVEASDWLVLSTPLTPETHSMIGPGELARMKPDAVLINLGRGKLVDESALISTLQAGRIAGAALDVFENEPLPESSPLWAMPNVIVTPHISGFGPRYWERAMELFAGNLRRYISGEPLQNVVDKHAGY